MYILHPAWLARREIIERGMEVGIETNLARPGMRFHLPKPDAVWSISPDRVVVESTNGETDCGAIIAKVLEALPETPLFAIGNNVVYEAELGELESLSDAIRKFPQIESAMENETVGQRSFHVGVNTSDSDLVNIQLSIHQEKIELACNSHRKLDESKDPNKAAVESAKRFFLDREKACNLAQHFFGSITENDIHKS